MFPIHDLEGIEKIERNIEGNHIIILLMVKPQDENAEEIIRNFNYMHVLSGKHCSIYPIGYSEGFCERYPDAIPIDGAGHVTWEYSDTCFIKVCKQLKRRLTHWNYSHEPELIILKNTSANENGSVLDFRGYNYIDINYGVKEGYIRSFSNFLGNLIQACDSEVEPQMAVTKARAKSLSCRRILEAALKSEWTKQKMIRKILKDATFFKSYRDAA